MGGATARCPHVQARPDVRRAHRPARPRTIRVVTPQVFFLLLTLAAVVIAVWLDLRFENRRPESLRWRIGHAVVAFVVLELSTAGVAAVLRAQTPVGEQTLVLFLGYLPSMLYAFLTGIWLIRTLVDIAGLVRR
jgi:flagellar biosynthesis protein FliQ